ncbi:MAG TPA: aldo/keto reductase [Candidatus Galloscillospira excrementipullorum]|nr:aldo/keto reductase [Candidatus Galloscillospira excrementipullorum]
MEYRELRGGKEKVSLLGFGCMRLPRLYPDKPEIDTELGQRMVDYAYSHGVNYFDTAYPYHEGLSEPFIGAALSKYPRESYNLVTKLPTWLINGEADIEHYFNEQLQKCGVDYFDFYLVHSLNAERFETVQKLHIFENLCELKAKGKIRHIGFSFHDKPDVLERILAAHDWEFAQIQLNYLDWELQDARRQYELIEQKGIQCTIMEPVRGGMLATLTPEAVDCFQQANPNVSTASWAIRYAASLPNVLTVLSGMTNFDHVTDNVATMEAFRPLSQQEREVIDHALAAYRKAVTIPCTGCRYCMDCPAGVSIPEVFAAYNRYATSKSRSMFEELYHALDAGQRADNCVACGTCLPKCPQHIDIPKHMKEIAALAEKKG